MKIAVACDDLNVSSHAALCTSFMCYTVDRGVITDCRNLPNPGLPCNEAAQMLVGLGINTIIAGGIDMDFANCCCYAGVEVVAGVRGTAREVADNYINHTLIGAAELCHISEEEIDPEDDDIDKTFADLERQFVTSA